MTRLGAPAILTFKAYRFEWALIVLLTAAGAIAALAASAVLGSMNPAEACLPMLWGGPIGAGDVGSCRIEEFLAFRDAVGERVAVALPWVSVIGGALVGSQIVSREMEFRTAQFIWALEPTRSRWFAERIGLSVIALAICAGVAGLTGSLLLGARFPGLDPTAYVPAYGQAGAVVVPRAIAALACGVLVGTIVGRTIPSLVVSLLIAAAIVTVSPVIALRTAPGYVVDAGSQINEATEVTVQSAWVGADGVLLDQDQARALSPTPDDPLAAQAWINENLRAVSIRIRGESLPQVAMYEAIALIVLSIAALWVSHELVRRQSIA